MPATTTRPGSRARGPQRSNAKDSLDHFRRFAETLRRQDDESGEIVPFELCGFQEAILEDYFAGFLETLAEIPSGNGKTTLFSAVGLHHATYVRHNARVLILSASGKQAQQMWEAAAGFVGLSPTLSRWWKPQMYGLGRIKSLTDRGMIEIVSPSPKVTEGEIPSLFLGDEIHRAGDDGRAYSMVLSKLKKRKARTLAATTAGEDEDSFLGRKRKQALAPECDVRGHLREGTGEPRPGEFYTVSHDPMGVVAWHEWSVPDHVQPDDYASIKRANPLPSITPEVLAQTHVLLKTRPWDWSRQIMNRWELGERSAIDPILWRDCHDPHASPLADAPFWVGFDMGGVEDSTAIVPVWRIEVPDDDGNPVPEFVTCRGKVIWPPGDGSWTLVDDVLEAMDSVAALPGKFQGLVFDRNRGGGYVSQELERKRSWTIIDHDQAGSMDSASELLATTVAEKRLHHDGDEAITRQVLAAAAKRSRRNRWYLAKPARHRKIDAAVALAMALRVANAGPVESHTADDFTMFFNA